MPTIGSVILGTATTHKLFTGETSAGRASSVNYGSFGFDAVSGVSSSTNLVGMFIQPGSASDQCPVTIRGQIVLSTDLSITTLKLAATGDCPDLSFTSTVRSCGSGKDISDGNQVNVEIDEQVDSKTGERTYGVYLSGTALSGHTIQLSMTV